MNNPKFIKNFVNWVEGEDMFAEDGKTTVEKSGRSITRGVKKSSIGSAESAKKASVKSAADAHHIHGIEDIVNMPAHYEATVSSGKTAMLKVKAAKRHNKEYRALSVIVCVSVIAVLLITTAYLPSFGNPDNPANNEVYRRYVEDGLDEAGAVNTVAGMILDYRAFDTLGESNVLFIAVCSVIILLRADKNSKDGKYNLTELSETYIEGAQDAILRVSACIIVPAAILFGIYVILNGHLSAGGGFSGGAIIGGALILYVNAFGSEKIEKYFTFNTYKWVTFAALITYTLLKTYSFYTGANGLESGISLGTPGAILSSGLILPLNVCVGLVVACTMYTFYSLFRKGAL